MYNIAQYIANDHDVRIFSLVNREVQPEYLEALEEFCSEVKIFPYRPYRRLNALRGLVNRPLALRNYLSWELDAALVEAAPEVDIIHFHFIRTAQYVRPEWPSVFDSHNVDHVLWQRRADSAQNPLKKLYHRRQASLLDRWESGIVKSSSAILACSKVDAALLTPDAEVVPNGADCGAGLDRQPAAAEYVYMGDMRWPPNIDASLFFCKEVLPLLRAKVPGAHVTLIGDRPAPAVKALASDAVSVTGQVKSVAPFLAQATALVVPLLCGSGTHIKILEAMAGGVPVVSTSVGCAGLDVVDGEHLLIADKPEDIADACARLATESSYAATLTQNARALVETRYNWTIIVQNLERIYTQLSDSSISGVSSPS